MCQCQKESETCSGTCGKAETPSTAIAAEEQQPEVPKPAKTQAVPFTGVTAIGATNCQCEACRGKSQKPTQPACQCDACRR